MCKKKPKKIKEKLFFISTVLETGGAETVLYNIVKELYTEYEIRVASLGSEGDIGKKISDLNIPVVGFKLNPNFPSMHSIFKLLLYTKNYNPNVIITWQYHANFLAGLICKLSGFSNIIWSIHHSDINSKNTKLRTRIIIWISSYLSHFVPRKIHFCSEKSLKNHVKIGFCKTKCHYIPNGFNLSKFRKNLESQKSVKNELGVEQNSQIVGHIARFDLIKNHKLFLDMGEIILNKFSHLHLVLVGLNVDKNNATLMEWMSESNFKNRIHLLGYRTDIPMLLNSFNICVLTSHSEAFPIILGESMACEVPCISTNVGDAATILAETGIIVDSFNKEEFAIACEKLLKLNPEDLRELGVSARKRVIENYDIKNVSLEFIKFIHGC